MNLNEFKLNQQTNKQKLRSSIRPKYMDFMKDIIQGLAYLHSQVKTNKHEHKTNEHE